MPTTTRQMAKLAGASEQSIRNWSRDYAELLSPSARGEHGPRLFDDADAQTLRTIAELRRANVPPDEVMARLRGGDVYIDVVPHTTPQQATPSPQESHSEAFAPPMVLSSLVARLEAVERHQARLLSEALRWGMVLGAIGALVAGAFVLWLLWLVNL
jgi:DNA-binding transcriptional MerR regulator